MDLFNYRGYKYTITQDGSLLPLVMVWDKNGREICKEKLHTVSLHKEAHELIDSKMTVNDMRTITFEDIGDDMFNVFNKERCLGVLKSKGDEYTFYYPDRWTQPVTLVGIPNLMKYLRSIK